MPIPEISPPGSSRFASVPTERALVNGYLRLVAAVAENNADNVEAAGWRPIAGKAADILPGYGQDVPLLVEVDRGGGRRKANRTSRLDLNEAQNSVVPADQINFPAVEGNAEVRRNDLIAEGPQMEVRLNFTVLARQQVLWFSRWEMPAGKFQTADDDLGQPDHGASGEWARASR